MSKKSIIIILVLSVLVTYGVAIADALRRKSLLAGEAGLPFRFSSASLFGSESTDQFMFLLDVFFWTIVLFGIWKLILKAFKK